MNKIETEQYGELIGFVIVLLLLVWLARTFGKGIERERHEKRYEYSDIITPLAGITGGSNCYYVKVGDKHAIIEASLKKNVKDILKFLKG